MEPARLRLHPRRPARRLHTRVGGPARCRPSPQPAPADPCPDLPVKQAEQRWAAYLDDDAARDLLAGQTLLYTDFNPLNVLMDSGNAWIIDWAWPTRGAAFIDPACLLLRLMLGGHTIGQAEAWAARCDSWATAPDKAIDAFALACARLYAEIAREDPQPWKARLAIVSREWGADSVLTAARAQSGTASRWRGDTEAPGTERVSGLSDQLRDTTGFLYEIGLLKRYGWVGGTGTSAHITPATGTVATLLTQVAADSPTPPEWMRDFWRYAASAA